MKKILRILLRGTGFLLALLLTLLSLYLLYNANLFHHRNRPTPQQLQACLSLVKDSDPLQYVAEKFDTHQVVFLGEIHRRKQDLDFLKALIPYLYRNKGIRMIGWEFGAACWQKAADSVVTAPSFDRAKAISIMRNSNYFWCYEDYLDVFRVIWQLNKSIAGDSNKVRFLQLNKPYVPRRWDSRIDSIRLQERKTSFDNILPQIVEKEVIDKNKKILIYCGLHHSLTKFKTPKFFFLKDQDGRAGQILYAKYPDRIFQICLLAPFPPRWLFFNSLLRGREGKYVYPFDGLFNQLEDSLQKPFALDTDLPAFADLKDYDSFYAFDRLTGVALHDFCDGIIMPAPFDKISPVAVVPDWISTDRELEEVKAVLPETDARRIHSAADLMNYINPAASMQLTRDYHHLPPIR